MPETTDVDTQALEQWFDANAVGLLIIAALLLVLYAISGRIVHAAVARALAAQKGQVEPGSPEAVELDKRAATLSSLATALLRIVVAGIIASWPQCPRTLPWLVCSEPCPPSPSERAAGSQFPVRD